MEISENKIYKLPDFKIVQYNEYFLAIAVNYARWLVLTKSIQIDILQMLQSGKMVGEVMTFYKDFFDDAICVLTQIEAIGIEHLTPKSIFDNKRLHLHLTNKCNLRCPHCYMNSGVASENELTTDEIKMLCKNFVDMGGYLVSITGGEPLLRDDFFEIIEYISNIGLKICIFSNGIAWNENLISRMARLNIEGVQISIDGYDEESNSQIRGKKSFKKALDTIDLLVKYNISVKVAITPLYSLLEAHADRYIAFAKELINKYGSNAISVNFSYALMSGREIDQEQISAEKEKYFNAVDKIVNSVYGDVAIDSFVENIADGIYDSCGYGGLNVMANGDFYFCDRIPDTVKAGNIRDLSFKKISKLIKLAEEAGRIDNFKPCCFCELKYICGGGCRIEFWGDFARTTDVRKIDFDKISPKICESDFKENIYLKMIQTFERFYR